MCSLPVNNTLKGHDPAKWRAYPISFIRHINFSVSLPSGVDIQSSLDFGEALASNTRITSR